MAHLEQRVQDLETELETKVASLGKLSEELGMLKAAKARCDRQLKRQKIELYGLLEGLHKSSTLMERSCRMLGEAQDFGNLSLEYLDVRANEQEIRGRGSSVGEGVRLLTDKLETQLRENTRYLRGTPCTS